MGDPRRRERLDGEGKPFPEPVFCLSVQRAWFTGSHIPQEVLVIQGP
jgi:hypothetical protein